MQLLWSHSLDAPVRGLVAARERQWVLTWDAGHWLRLFNVARRQRQAQSHVRGPLAAAACAEDGLGFARLTAEGRVALLAPDLTPRWEHSLGAPGLAVALAPLGEFLAASDSAGFLHLFAPDGGLVWKTSLPRPFKSLAFVPEKPLLVGCADFGLVGCLDAAGQLLRRDGLVAHTGSLACSREGGFIAVACYSDGLWAYDLLGKKRQLSELAPCRLAALSYAGDFILSAGLERRVSLSDGAGRLLDAREADAAPVVRCSPPSATLPGSAWRTAGCKPGNWGRVGAERKSCSCPDFGFGVYTGHASYATGKLTRRRPRSWDDTEVERDTTPLTLFLFLFVHARRYSPERSVFSLVGEPFREHCIPEDRRRPAGKDTRMLVLSRRLQEKIVFPDIGTTLQIVSVKGGTVRLSFDAPENVRIFREEVLAKLEAEAARLASATGERPRALLVEDDRNERELLAGFLRLAGVEVGVAGDGADALEYLQSQQRPDVVLLDMLMPRCDGPTTVRAIRRDPTFAGLKIFGVTGVSDDTFGLAEGSKGIDRWFRKPLNPETLLRELLRDLHPRAN